MNAGDVYFRGRLLKQIVGTSRYLVGADGSVWRRKGNHVRRMKTHWNRFGYERVTLRPEPRVKRSYYVHRLVLLAWVGPCPDGMEGCHGPAGQRDNSLSNLRWDTPQANVADRVRERHRLAQHEAGEPMDF